MVKAPRPRLYLAMLGGTGFAAGVAKARQAQRRAVGAVRPAPAAPPPDLAGQLRELVTLRDEGALTPEEFETAKRRLLAG
jgi:hypothetical protein